MKVWRDNFFTIGKLVVGDSLKKKFFHVAGL